MVIGIVGSEQAKFTSNTEQKAREIINQIIIPYEIVCSGGCHLGGIDIYTREIAIDKGKTFWEFRPKAFYWAEYKKRNIEIAKNSDKVVCITVRRLPDSYTGMKFSKCYHCGTSDHVKSGGCWTMKYAARIGKETQLIVIE